jgi:twinkle protein
MKYQSLKTGLVYEFEFNESKKRYVCPECSHNRRKKNAKDLDYYSDTNSAYCWHCESTFFKYKPYTDKQYKKPEFKNLTKLSEKALKWFDSRGIKSSTINKFKIYSDVEYMPQKQKEVEVICFPYYRNGELVNIKYRAQGKLFKQYSGAELIFWNYDEILSNNETLIICEGEIDLLTYVQNGIENVVSVPAGAGKNTEYLDNCIDLLTNKEKIVLSVDTDEKGLTLKNELIRRIGTEKCYSINFRECKDANEFFKRYGGNEFLNAYNSIKPIPVSGIINISDFENEIDDLYKHGIQPGKTINHELIDNYVTWETSRLAICTGIPSSGKSEFVDYVVCKLNLEHGWKVAYFSPENYPLKFHYAKIHSKFSGKKFKEREDTTDYFSIKEYLKENIFYILNEENNTVENIISKAKHLVKTKGIKVLVLDPWNKFDHNIESKETETSYISRMLDKIIWFAKSNEILVFLVAHPTKMQNGTVPTLYNISGSAHFYNKTDYGFTVDRLSNEKNVMTTDVDVHMQKVKFKHLGEQGIIELKYNYFNGRYENRDFTVDNYDGSDWLTTSQIENNTHFWNETETKAPF